MSSDIQKLQRAYQRSIKKVRDERIDGIVGRGLNYADVNAPRRNHIWVTIADSVAQIRNSGPGRVLARAGLPVKLIRRYNGELVLDGNDVSGLLDDDANNPGDVFSVNNILPDATGNVTVPIPENLADLADVNDTPPVSGDVLQFSDFDNLWSGVPVTGLGLTLDDLNGVTITAPANGDVLTYSAGDWINAAPSASYTDEMAQDAVAAAAIDTATIDFTYTDATPELKWDVKSDSITNTLLANMANATVKGRTTAGTGDPEDLTMAQLVALIEVQALYALLAGRSGGQTINGGTAANEDMVLRGTAHATKASSYVVLADDGGFVIVGAAAASGTGDTELDVVPNGVAVPLRLRAGTGGAAYIQFTPANASAEWGFFSALSGSMSFVHNTGPIIFSAAAVEAMRINANGRVDITQATLGEIVQRLASTATNDDPVEDTVQNRIATTTGATTTLHTFTIPASTTVLIIARVVARRTGGVAGTAEDGAAYTLQGAYKNVAGTATILGGGPALTTILGESQAGFDATLSVSGATVLVRVVGAANNNVSWHMTAKVYSISS